MLCRPEAGPGATPIDSTLATAIRPRCAHARCARVVSCRRGCALARSGRQVPKRAPPLHNPRLAHFLALPTHSIAACHGCHGAARHAACVHWTPIERPLGAILQASARPQESSLPAALLSGFCTASPASALKIKSPLASVPSHSFELILSLNRCLIPSTEPINPPKSTRQHEDFRCCFGGACCVRRCFPAQGRPSCLPQPPLHPGAVHKVQHCLRDRQPAYVGSNRKHFISSQCILTQHSSPAGRKLDRLCRSHNIVHKGRG